MNRSTTSESRADSTSSPADEECEVLRRSRYLPEPDLPLAVHRLPFQADMAVSHRHEFDELMIVTGGTATHHFAGQTEHLRRGDVYFIPEGLSHRYDCAGGSKLAIVNVLFSFSGLDMDWKDLADVVGFRETFQPSVEGNPSVPPPARMSLQPQQLPQLALLINGLDWELGKREPGYRFHAKGYFARIIGFLSRISDAGAARSNPMASDLLRVLSYMEEHLHERLSIEELCSEVGIPPSSLRRRFREVFGESPVHHVQRLRVERSMELLADVTISVSEIADAVGFHDTNYYARVFRRITSCSPSEYREELIRGET